MQINSTFALELNSVSSAGFAQPESRGGQSYGSGKHPPLLPLDQVTSVWGQFGVRRDCQAWTEQETQGLSALQGASPSSAPPEVMEAKRSISPKPLFIDPLEYLPPLGKHPG